jgi:hypothetical protein
VSGRHADTRIKPELENDKWFTVFGSSVRQYYFFKVYSEEKKQSEN